MLKCNKYAKWLVVSGVALMALPGCSGGNIDTPTTSNIATPTNSAPVSSNAPLNADQVEDAVENAFKADSKLKALALDVDEDKGSVILKGTVQNAEEKALAEEIAKRTAPGVPVVNQINVVASTSTNSQPTNQPAIDADKAEDYVSDAFKANTTLKPLNIEADQENGGILIKGIVQTAEQRTLAENVAKQAAPNFSINNQIRIAQ